MMQPDELAILRAENQRLRTDLRCVTAERDALKRTLEMKFTAAAVRTRVGSAMAEWADQQKPRHGGPPE